MEEFYTAIGIKREPGSFSVVSQGEQFSLYRAEPLLWTILQGRFLKKDEIYPEMYAKCLNGRMEKIGEEEAAYCLRRLSNRRLVIKISAEDSMDAQRKILQRSVVAPTDLAGSLPASSLFRKAFGEPGRVSAHDKTWQKRWEHRERTLLKMLSIFGEVPKYLEAVGGSWEVMPTRFAKYREEFETFDTETFLSTLGRLHRERMIGILEVQEKEVSG